MNLADRVNAFAALGKKIAEIPQTKDLIDFWRKVETAHIHNQWFTNDFCKKAITEIAVEWLAYESLSGWLKQYPESYFSPINPKRVGVVMAGNVPFVGFHDLLCTLVAGHHFVGKISSKDGGLMQAVIDLLISIEPRFASMISITDARIDNFNAIIATGSDNSARYFDYYFGKYPNIIRKNRHSIAILSGSESPEELSLLANDIFTYFGLGCRSVSKILVPMDYNFDSLFAAFKKFNFIKDHNKYANNYEYYRAIYLMNQVSHLDNGFVILKPDTSLGSPVGVVFYQNYNDFDSVTSYINQNKESLQCVASGSTEILNTIPLGETQKPKLYDYADGIDTIEFLASV